VVSGDQRSTPVCGEDIVDAKASFDVLRRMQTSAELNVSALNATTVKPDWKLSVSEEKRHH
jgi:hypothetical protein